MKLMKNKLLYLSIVYTICVMLTTVAPTMQYVALGVLLLGTVLLSTNETFCYVLYSICFGGIIRNQTICALTYLVVGFVVMFKAIALSNKKLSHSNKFLLVALSVVLLISPIIKAIIVKGFNFSHYSFYISILEFAVALYYTKETISIDKLYKTIISGVGMSFSLLCLFYITNIVEDFYTLNLYGNAILSSFAVSNSLVALCIIAEIIIIKRILTHKANNFDIVAWLITTLIGFLSAPSTFILIGVVLSCIAIVASYRYCKNKSSWFKKYLIVLVMSMTLGIIIVSVAQIKGLSFFHFFSKDLLSPLKCFKTLFTRFDNVWQWLFGEQTIVQTLAVDNNIYFNTFCEFGLIGLLILISLVVVNIKNIKLSYKKCCFILLSSTIALITNSIAGIIILLGSVMLNDNSNVKEKIDNKEQIRNFTYLFLKRLFDISVALIGIILTIIPMLLIMIVNAPYTKCRPLIFIKRVGKDGKLFKLCKFRSMYIDAEAKIEKYLTKEQIAIWQRERKIDNDPRITKIGKFLRKTSLDELPQLFNILLGDLSVIGNRPLSPIEYDTHFSLEDKSMLNKMRPGLTGYWQVYGRSNVDFLSGERQKMYLYYSKHPSIWLDIKIFFKTFLVVLSHKGAK